eukprot:TRINITY_DN1179_c0_g1_i2.p1 TRINITY_DN1179_c0_g1~~TRINITY_DN1179_c0_g1_i2.p1  ORF type:complete len:562 (-),score=118.34 TRINITY_DN1179_c0_g1_i2:35-1720(-)
MKAIRETYKIMKESSADVSDILGKALYKLTTRLQTCQHDDLETLRLYLILLENPVLLEAKVYSVVLERVIKKLVTLPSNLKNVLHKWWSNLPSEFFFHIVSVFEAMLAYCHSHSMPSSLVLTASLLESLFQINKTSSIIPYSSFYNDEVNAFLRNPFNLEQEFLKSKNNATFSYCQHPYLLDVANKSRIIKLEAVEQMRSRVGMAFLEFDDPYVIFEIRREKIIEDAFNQVSRHKHELLKPLKVIFVGEQGVDQGGLQKEFFQILIRDLFHPDYGMFVLKEESNTFWFNSNFLEESLYHFELIGTLLGLAIHNQIILDVHFSLVVWKKLLGMKPTLNDLKDVDPVLAKSLQQVLDFEGNVENAFNLTFQIEYQFFGEIKKVDLISGGWSVPVTNENKKAFVDLYVKWTLEESIKAPFTSFYNGFYYVCGHSIIKTFQPEELERIVCGLPEVDFNALRKVTQYANGYNADHQVIQMFWEVVMSMNPEQRKKLLFFVTGSDRLPVTGTSDMKFVIQKSGGDSDRLPVAHTCFNILDLPPYSSQEKLRDKLLKAISFSEGFGLE